jgi:stearoyl-CoA desaturase (delta-9 desaturase)
MTFDIKLKALWIISHVVTFYVIYEHFSLFWLITGYIWYVIIKGIGSEIGAHRYFTHKSFDTTDKKAALLTWLQTLCGEGSVLTFVGIHRLHHSFSDTDKDPHSPLFNPWYKVLFFIKKIYIPIALVKDCLRNKHVKLQHQYYFKIHGLLLMLGIFFPVYYGYLVAMPILLSIYTNGIINIFLHLYGEKITGSNARNNRGLNIILYGAGYHANHHNDPKNYRYHESTWIDPVGGLIHKVFKKT